MERRLTTYLAVVGTIGLAACSTSTQADTDMAPDPAAPIPTAALAGQEVTVYPLTLALAQESLEWEQVLPERKVMLAMADSILAEFLIERTPEVTWVLPRELRRAHRLAPTMLANPDQMGTSILRNAMERIPDPLRSQLRNLNGVAGERFAMVPAALLFFKEADDTVAMLEGVARAELTLVVIDVVTGQTRWRTVAWGNGDDPWEAYRAALRPLVPGLP